MKRPALVTVLSVIHYIIGSALLFLTLDTIAIYILYKTVGLERFLNLPINPPMIASDYPYFMMLGLYAILSFISFYTGYGLWKGWSWIWYLEIGLNFVMILNELFLIVASNNLAISIIVFINIGIIYLLRRDDIKSFFRLYEGNVDEDILRL